MGEAGKDSKESQIINILKHCNPSVQIDLLALNCSFFMICSVIYSTHYMHIFISTTYNVQEIKVNFLGSGSSRIGDLKYITCLLSATKPQPLLD